MKIKQKVREVKRKNRNSAFAKQKLLCKSIRIKRISPANTILLSGSGRSGTTWLANIIGSCRGTGIIFEPFDHRKVHEAKNFSLRDYLRPRENYPEKKVFVERVLSGNVHNAWTDRENKNFLIWKYLVKSIRANLMLAWIDYNFHCPIIYVIRHPCAVVLSRMKLNWEAHLDVFLQQEELIEDYLHEFEPLIRKAQNPIQKHTIMWCVENLIPLSQLAQHDWILCTYEKLCNNTKEEIYRIFKRLGIKQTKRINYAISSCYQTRKDSAIRTGRDPLNDWKKTLSKNEINEILGIVNDFGVDLYGKDLFPIARYLKGLE